MREFALSTSSAMDLDTVTSKEGKEDVIFTNVDILVC